MLKFLRWLYAGRESGQALIFAAVCAPVMVMFMGLALEGGRTFVEFRRMQSAADMAALVGAENLPNHWAAAVTDACGYAAVNMSVGSAGTPCGSVGTTGVTLTACVPPAINSPYPGFIRYGRANSSCSTPQGQSFYVDVQIQKTLSVPIFNQAFTISTHAVARNGGPSPKDFAIAVLDPTMCQALKMTGTANIVVVGPVISDSTAPNCSNTASMYTNSGGGSGYPESCDGAWFTSANEAYPPSAGAPKLVSITGGTPTFAPADCSNAAGVVGTFDAQTAFFPLTPPIPDPYGTGLLPNGQSSGTSFTSSTCQACQNSPAYLYEWTGTNRSTGTWHQADNSNLVGNGSHTLTLKSANFELFPGAYPNGIDVEIGANVYLNPGVYMIPARGFTQAAGTICIYGAPACDHMIGPLPGLTASGTNCQNASFNTGDTHYVVSSTWYYYCSPWGIYDTNPNLHAPGLSRPVSTVAPTFSDNTTKMNGVTFWMQPSTCGDCNNINSNGGNMIVAAPNPCPGDNTAWAAGSAAVAFRNGSQNAQYDYSANGSLPSATSTVTNLSPPGQLYPNADFSIAEDTVCTSYFGGSQPVEWTQEFGLDGSGAVANGQHLHFLWWSRDTNAYVNYQGNGGQNWFGIIYNPTAPPATKNQGYTVSENGTSGGGTGPPWVEGQIIADSISFSGSSTTEVYYRPCPTQANCETGPGSHLVQ